jgi:hypothetical protein
MDSRTVDRLMCVATMSAADGVAAVFPSRRQEPEIALGGTFRCDPGHSRTDIAAGGLWPKEIGCIIGYAVLRAVSEGPVNDRIPGNPLFVIGGSFTEVVGDPLGCFWSTTSP